MHIQMSLHYRPVRHLSTSECQGLFSLYVWTIIVCFYSILILSNNLDLLTQQWRHDEYNLHKCVLNTIMLKWWGKCLCILTVFLLELLWALVITPSVFMYLNSISVEVLFLWKYLDAVVELTDAKWSGGWFSVQSVQHLYVRFILNSYGVYIADFVIHCLKKASHVFVMHKALFLHLLYVCRNIYRFLCCVLRLLYVISAHESSFILCPLFLLSLLHHTLIMAFYMSQEKNKKLYMH